MRVPCIVRWPGRVPAGVVCREVISAMDLVPTIEGWAGVAVDENRPTIDGRDVSALLTDDEDARSPHEALFYYRDDRLQAVRSGRWKLHVHRPEWKGEARDPLLFDLVADLGERADVAGEHPQVVARLEALAETARVDLGDAATGRVGRGVRPVGR